MAQQDGLDGQAPRPRRRRRWPWITGGVFVALIVIGVVAGGGKDDKSDAKDEAPATVVESPSKSSSAAPTSKTPEKPQPKPTPKVVLSESGSGIKSTAKFKVDGDWDLHYSYDCAAFGGSGNFIVSDGSSALGAVYLNQLGKSGSDTTHLHDGGTKFLEINSECSWKVEVIDVP